MIAWLLIGIAVAMDGSYYTVAVTPLYDSQAKCEDAGSDLASNDGDVRYYVCAPVDLDARPKDITSTFQSSWRWL